MWRVYENNERGLKYEEYFKSEEEALEKLYKKVKFFLNSWLYLAVIMVEYPQI